MNDSGNKLAKARAIIASTCHMLKDTRQSSSQWSREFTACKADCYVLLHDATKLFCQQVAELYGETDCHRWSPAFPELLIAHPEKCAETIALVEQRDFKDLSYFQYVAV